MNSCDWKRFALIASNGPFLIPCAYIVYQNRKPRLTSINVFLAFIVLYLTFASALYHLCDDASGTVTCDSYCIADVNHLYFNDCFGAVLSCFVPLLYHLDKDHYGLDEMAHVIPWVMFAIPPFAIIFDKTFWLFVFTGAIAIGVLLYRLWIMMNHSFQNWSGLVIPYRYVIAFILVMSTSIVFEEWWFTDYYIIHSLWHCMDAIALMLGLLIIEKLEYQDSSYQRVNNNAPLSSHVLTSSKKIQY